MACIDVYPLITVGRLADSRDFFIRYFGMTVLFEASWVVMLSATNDGRIAVGLMSRDHVSQPPGPEVFDGNGMIVTIQVDDAAAALAGMEAAPVVYLLTDELWGQRRFMTRDPSGVLVDVVEQIEPAAGFWDAYMPS